MLIETIIFSVICLVISAVGISFSFLKIHWCMEDRALSGVIGAMMGIMGITQLVNLIG